MISIVSSKTAYDLFFQAYEDGTIQYKEYFYIMLLSRANKVLVIPRVSEGGLAGTVVDPKVIFQLALKGNAASIILCHNHPSGNLNPSIEDVRLTKKLKDEGKLLDLPVLDHLIITMDSYYSLADQGDI